MRKPKYLSPTSMSKWTENPNEYYLRYLSDAPRSEELQTQAMSVGSAFDAFVKSFLYEHLFGKTNPLFEWKTLFEEQVAPHNRDWAKDAGERCFNTYRHLGALDNLMIDLGRSKGPPKFEVDCYATIRDASVDGVPFRVKPDLHYVNEHGARVILDWKVNGYCSTSGQSPKKGFVRARRSGKMPWCHEDCDPVTYKGLLINEKTLENYDEEWARQCSVGAWACGDSVGGDFVAVIHQLACRPNAITIAEHAGHVSVEHQRRTFREATAMWEAINSGHVFRHLPLEDSIALCALLDQRKETREEGIKALNPMLED